MSITVMATAFSPNGAIPKIYTCDGADASPELSWSGAPSGVQSFALIVDDPDAPVGTWTHWLIWNIPAQGTGLVRGVPTDETLADGARQGRNDFRRIGYSGPCPPAGKPHRYFFRLYALDAKINLKSGATRNELERAMKGHVLAQGELMAKYGR
jgi:Raf kinase inhibitor-like YbhB/YbcL family protein